jgi:hypothetical protein
VAAVAAAKPAPTPSGPMSLDDMIRAAVAKDQAKQKQH